MKTSNMVPASIILAGTIIGAALWYQGTSAEPKKLSITATPQETTALEEAVVPSAGVELPLEWGDMGQKLVSVGAIDGDRFEAYYKNKNEYTAESKRLLRGTSSGHLRITKENAAYLLNLFWALGLANKNEILESGEMSNPKYGGADHFASTGGWTMAVGDPMNHYSKHVLVKLTPEEQALVEKISRGVYRPCCNNSTHFPDCNHGMAMLGLLELMASQGATESEMWRAALAVNSFWFPDTYETIALYMESRGVAWKDVDPRMILGPDYSSATGYLKIAAMVKGDKRGGGGSCSV